MTLQSDLSINASKFLPEAASNEIKNLNEFLMDSATNAPKWFEVGDPKYREMRAKGETALPEAIILERGRDISIPSREDNREIPCRVMVPENGVEAKAVFMHIHGGGFVLSSEKECDPLLAKIADLARVAVVSVGYRLAPENPFPAAPEYCFDAAEWLIDNSKEKFGVELQFIGGENSSPQVATSPYPPTSTSRTPAPPSTSQP
ncbi:MAG: hypothetical protein Q9226_004981 [Calogaya cf. arnoldii]